MYEEILRQARYRLRHGAALYARKFRLSCSEMNGRYSSNEFIVEVPGSLLPSTAKSRGRVDSTQQWWAGQGSMRTSRPGRG